jgi:hypothetical protein
VILKKLYTHGLNPSNRNFGNLTLLRVNFYITVGLEPYKPWVGEIVLCNSFFLANVWVRSWSQPLPRMFLGK